jgi:hypothetical protein
VAGRPCGNDEVSGTLDLGDDGFDAGEHPVAIDIPDGRHNVGQVVGILFFLIRKCQDALTRDRCVDEILKASSLLESRTRHEGP